tara:strand:- start:272 stop:595 length:324 start_codon:yes stop_codon:yes gene_type:complete
MSVEIRASGFSGEMCTVWQCNYLDDDSHFCEAKYHNLITDIRTELEKTTIDTGYGVQFPPADSECLKKIIKLKELATEFRVYVRKYDLMVKKSRGLDENGFMIDNET